MDEFVTKWTVHIGTVFVAFTVLWALWNGGGAGYCMVLLWIVIASIYRYSASKWRQKYRKYGTV